MSHTVSAGRLAYVIVTHIPYIRAAILTHRYFLISVMALTKISSKSRPNLAGWMIYFGPNNEIIADADENTRTLPVAVITVYHVYLTTLYNMAGFLHT